MANIYMRERESDITPCVQRYERDVEVERRHCFYSMREERRIDWIRKRDRERRERKKERESVYVKGVPA